MRQDDVAGILLIQAACYPPSMQEDEATIRARLAAAPDSAWVASDGDGICAYLAAYRSQLGKVTPLAGRFEPAPAADCLYLHDLAVAPRAGGRGLGPQLAATAWQAARGEGLGYSALVSVQESQPFWRRLGYAVHDALEPLQRQRLSSYDAPAWYMVKRLD
ncbi:MAG: GNAT family N-acetyltransferase [Burkholderiaceae bacterium]